jgi:magnesium transporter
MRLARLIGPELEALLRESPDEIVDLLEEVHPEDFADIVHELDDVQASELLTRLPTDYAAQVFERLDETRQEQLAGLMGTDSTARIATEMRPDDRADFFSILPPDFAQPLLESIEKVNPEVAEDVEQLTRWPEKTAGGLMTTDFVAIGPDLRISEAIEEVRRLAREAETLEVVYAVGQPDNRLLGLLTLRNLLLADPAERVLDVIQRNVISVPPELDQEEVARTLAKYDLHTIPVVDQHGVLLGVITADDVLDVVHEEQSEDVQKMAAVAPIGESYFDASALTYIKKRAPWLMILFVSGFFTTTAMKAFDGVLASIAQLAFYVPLLIAAGGNSGSQSSTLVIRALAVGQIQTKDWWRVLLREVAQGLVLGAMLAVFGVARVLFAGDGAEIAVVIALTIMGIVLMGCVVGGMMPIILHRFGIDPATSSTPFIATLVDVLGIVIYLGLAQLLLLGASAALGSPP